MDIHGHRVDPEMLKLFFYNLTGYARNGDPGK